MATLQVRIDDTIKKQADTLFSSLGLDTSTAIRIFLNAAIENAGIPFSVQHRAIPYQLQEALPHDFRECHIEPDWLLNCPFSAKYNIARF